MRTNIKNRIGSLKLESVFASVCEFYIRKVKIEWTEEKLKSTSQRRSNGTVVCSLQRECVWVSVL